MRTAAGKTTPALQLFLYRNHWQLAAETALYSDGAAYRPLKRAFQSLKNRLNTTKSMLVLGAGLGSAAYVLDDMGLHIPLTFVDIDDTSIAWAQELMPPPMAQNAQWHCADVRDFVGQHPKRYDMVVLDIFIDRIVPSFIVSPAFLNACSRLLNGPDALLVFNYIINKPAQWQSDRQLIESVFKIDQVIDLGLNQVLILQQR
jgi:spermidine synthase